jgi:hypothetical protein
MCYFPDLEPYSRLAWNQLLPPPPLLICSRLAQSRGLYLIGWWMGGSGTVTCVSMCYQSFSAHLDSEPQETRAVLSQPHWHYQTRAQHLVYSACKTAHFVGHGFHMSALLSVLKKKKKLEDFTFKY